MGKRKIEPENDSEQPLSKSGPVNFNLLGSDIAVLQQFVDLIGEDSDEPDSYDIVKDYLDHHDGSELISWLKDAFTRKQKELRVIMEALSGVLLRTARDLKPTYGEVGRRLGDQIMEYNVDVVLKVFQPGLNAVVKKSGLKLLTSLVAQDVLVANTLMKRFNWDNAVFRELCKSRNKLDSMDVRSWFVNFILSFFILGDNSLIRSMLDKKDIMDMVIRNAHIDKYSTVMLIIKVLHEKVIKNSSITKTLKVRLFHKQCMDYLGNLMNWRGEATTHAEWKDRLKFPSIDSDDLKEKIRDVQGDILSMLKDLTTSPRYGIVFIDKYVGTNASFCNGNLMELFTNLDDPRQCPRIKELLLNCVAVCPDVIPVYLKRLAPFLQPRPSEKWYTSMALMKDLYQAVPNLVKPLCYCAEVCSPDQVARVIANLTLTPPALAEMFTTCANLKQDSPVVFDKANDLIDLLIGRFRLALSWLQTTDKISDPVHKTVIYDKLKKLIHEVEGWCQKFINLFNEDLFDPSLLKSEESILYDYLDVKKEEPKLSDENLLDRLPHKLRRAVEKIENVDTVEKKTAVILDHLSEFIKESIVIKALNKACSVAKTSMKKKAFKRFIVQIFSAVVSHEEFLSLLAPTVSEQSKLEPNQDLKNSLIDLLLTVYSYAPDHFIQHMNLLPLLAAYTATMKQSGKGFLILSPLQGKLWTT